MYHNVSIAQFSKPGTPGHRWGCNDVIALVSRVKRVPVQLFRHQSRGRARAALARQLAMYLCHVALSKTLAEVGEAFDRDRTTVAYACTLIEDLREDGGAFDDEVSELERQIEDAQAGAQ